MKPTTAKTRVAICDIDNCVSNDGWRVRLIDWNAEGDDRYHAYHAAGFYDAPDLHWLASELDQDLVSVLIFITTRPQRYRETTVRWLEKHLHSAFGRERFDSYFLRGGVDRHLMMRADNDKRSSAAVKSELARTLMSGNNLLLPSEAEFVAAYDDRDDVLEAYTALGIPAFKHSIHDVCAYTPPNAAPAQATPADIMRASADIYEQRNAVYKDNWRAVGNALIAMFPEGVTLKSADDFAVWHLFELAVVKMTRLANSGLSHGDSAVDGANYLAMVASLNHLGGLSK